MFLVTTCLQWLYVSESFLRRALDLGRLLDLETEPRIVIGRRGRPLTNANLATLAVVYVGG